MGWVRANLLTLASVIVVIAITIMLDIPVSIAYSAWFIAFLLDSSYTYLNRRYIRYEMNIIVRRSRDLVTAFIKVVCIEYAIIFMLSLLLIDYSSGLAVSFMIFAVVHTSAFLRSYMFIRKKEEK